MSTFIGLSPIIPAFTSRGLYIVGLQQKRIAESWHYQDNNTVVHQYVTQSSGWPISLVAYRDGDQLLGFFTTEERNTLMQAKDIVQTLTINHPDLSDGVRVVFDNMNLESVQNDPVVRAGTLYTGSINFRRI